MGQRAHRRGHRAAEPRAAYPLWQQVVHQVNHATQHRSEIAATLTRFGHSPGDLDLLVFVDESETR